MPFLWYNVAMKVGISTACLKNACQTEESFSHIEELGAECLEIYLQTFYEYRPEFAKKYAVNAAGAEAFAVCVQPLGFEPQLFSENRRIRGDGLYWLDQVARSAKLFGAKNYLLRGVQCEENSVDKTLERLCGIAEFCSRYGLNLCLENSVFGTYSRPNAFKRYLSSVPALCGSLNLAAARKSAYPDGMYIEDMSGAIACVRLSDVGENGEICLPGQGVLNYKEIFARLFGAGFNGVAILDAPCGDITAVKRSLDYVKEIAQKLI